jgi:hypothetical protein
MIFNHLLGIWCSICKRYYDPHTEVFLNVLYEGSITCDKDHLCGNTSDPQWQEYFYGDEE